MLSPDIILFVFCFWIFLCAYLVYRSFKIKNRMLLIVGVVGIILAIAAVIWSIDIYPAYIE